MSIETCARIFWGRVERERQRGRLTSTTRGSNMGTSLILVLVVIGAGKYIVPAKNVFVCSLSITPALAYAVALEPLKETS